MFRLLGVHPGPDITVAAAASLAGVDAAQARQALRELAAAHLIAEHAPGRYAFHDLLRAYAAEQAASDDSEKPAGRPGPDARPLPAHRRRSRQAAVPRPGPAGPDQARARG